VTRSEAKEALATRREISYALLDDILRAFDCITRTPDFATEVYHHKEVACVKECGQFTARDSSGVGVLVAEQIDAVIWLIACIERWEKKPPPVAPGPGKAIL
jgi:hypothetical protein